MTESRLGEYLRHMSEAAADACGFVRGRSRDDFSADKRTQQAVIMSLVIIGEAASRTIERHADFAERHPEIPWRSMRGMRNRIAHGYFDVDLDVVWATVQTALPQLLECLARLKGDTRFDDP